MRIIIENVIASVRILTGAFGFFLFLLVGMFMGADLMPLIFWGGVFGIACYIIGLVLANILQQINKETQLEPIQEKEIGPEDLGGNIDILQDIEMPAIK